jgi:ketosteroid isomerase-like protein
MTMDATEGVKAVLAAISSAWQERRYADLSQLIAADMVFTLPGMSGRLVGRESRRIRVSAGERKMGSDLADHDF